MSLEGLHILVVDDEPYRQLLDTFLSTNAAQVTSCDDGESAYQKTVLESFNCIVSDVHMPTMGGVELLSKIRNILKCNTTLILISGNLNFTPSN